MKWFLLIWLSLWLIGGSPRVNRLNECRCTKLEKVGLN